MRTAGRGRNVLHPRCAAEGARAALASAARRRGAVTLLSSLRTQGLYRIALAMRTRRQLRTVAMGPAFAGTTWAEFGTKQTQCPSNAISVRTGTSIARNLAAPP